MAINIDGDGLIALGGTSTTQGRLRLAEDTDNGTNFVALQAPASIAADVTFTLPAADGTANQVLKTDGSGNLGFATPSVSKVLQVVHAKCGNGTSTARIAVDNSTPLNTEGVEIWTASITPTSASNTVLVFGACQASSSANTIFCNFALFRGSTCISALQTLNSISNAGVMLTLCVMDSPATTSSTTYSIRASADSNTLHFGNVFNNNYGNLGENYYILQEIAP